MMFDEHLIDFFLITTKTKITATNQLSNFWLD